MKAAESDPNRQSLYSRQLKELEEGVGLSLIDRSSTPHQLTAAGIRLEMISRGFIQEFERTVAECSGMDPVVSIGAGESIIQWLLLPLLAPWSADGGPVFRFLNLRGKKAEEGVRKRRLDLAVIGAASLPEGLGCQKIASYGMELIAAKRTLKRKPTSWAQLKGRRLAILEGSGRLKRRLDELLDEMVDPPLVALECTSYPQVIQACLEGDFIGLVPQVVKTSRLHPDLTLHKLTGLEDITVDLLLVWHPDSFRHRTEVRATMERLRSRKSG